MLEGKEVEGKIGNVGSYYVDVDAALNVELSVAVEYKEENTNISISAPIVAKVPLLAILKAVAAKSTNKVDDKVVEYGEELLALITKIS